MTDTRTYNNDGDGN